MEAAFRKGAKLDAWEEYFSLERWMEAFAECGLDPHFYANRRREHGEVLPWSHIDAGVTDAFLMREHDRCYEGATTPDCRTQCSGCGADRFLGRACDG